MLIIALSGRMGVGKDTIADYLVSNYGFVKIAFADSLKRVINELFGVPLDVLYDSEKKNIHYPLINCTPRELLRSVGEALNTLRISQLPPFIFNARAKLHELSYGERVVISDLRTNEEEEFLKAEGALFWRVKRQELQFFDEHPTETSHQAFGFHTIIENDSSLPELYSKIDSAISNLL
jgi:hypothetical protein